VTIDLGYVNNAGFTKKWGGHVAKDDQFAVEVEVIVSDSKPMAHDRTFGIVLAATVGDTIVLGKCVLHHAFPPLCSTALTEYPLTILLYFLIYDTGTQTIKVKRDSGTDAGNRKTVERGNIVAEVQNTGSITKKAG